MDHQKLSFLYKNIAEASQSLSAKALLIHFLGSCLDISRYTNELIAVNHNFSRGLNAKITETGKNFGTKFTEYAKKHTEHNSNELLTDTDIKLFNYSNFLVKTVKIFKNSLRFTFQDWAPARYIHNWSFIILQHFNVFKKRKPVKEVWTMSSFSKYRRPQMCTSSF